MKVSLLILEVFDRHKRTQDVIVSIEQVSQVQEVGKDTLILLDELGGGTDPIAGAAIAQAILEKMLNTYRCRIVSTTHSLELKSLPLSDPRFQSAAVLLSDDIPTESKYKLPSFQLSYGSIGDSYGLGAASRCSPSLPEDVIERASDIIVRRDGKGEVLRNVSKILEKEKELANRATLNAYDLQEDTYLVRDGTVALARAYETHFARLENRLEKIYSKLQNEKDKDNYDVIGDTIAEVRLVKKKIKTDKELLAEKGLKSIPPVYSFHEGENVVIIKKGEWEGTTATVIAVDSNVLSSSSSSSTRDSTPWSEVTVMPSFDWNPTVSTDVSVKTLTFRPNEIALWDYDDYEVEFNGWKKKDTAVTSVYESSQRLQDVLNNIDRKKTSSSVVSPVMGNGTKTGNSEKKTSFTSAHERKIARAKEKMARKKNKSKKKRR